MVSDQPHLLSHWLLMLYCVLCSEMVSIWEIDYLDDFLTIGSPQAKECDNSIAVMQSFCERAGKLIRQKACYVPNVLRLIQR